ncbi:hypothetical protein THAOC_21771 [Thalassiosira oceanica]|uniref:Uncharacterized protein n=1 Tax=Thalassiosira oceanica TaxID=159749 RepID=K0S0A2_THAOC|nr:hypothetical protein THAOC_21771 [Thalassiosira oceanica]|eukprot:EJK58129.1 hypothetical protein THAOC_21771 [Thalassiosira oceanica]
MPPTTLISKAASLPHSEHRESECSKKLVNVTGKSTRQPDAARNLPWLTPLLEVTVINVSGIYVKNNKKKRSLLRRPSFTRNSLAGINTHHLKIESDELNEVNTQLTADSDDVATSVVASFDGGRFNETLTHVNSLPLSPSNATSKPVGQVAHWARASTHTFQCAFIRENSSTSATTGHTKYEPQTMPIVISLARSGMLYKLGDADLLLSGDENGECCIPVIPIGKAPRKKSKVSLMQLKGESVKCGIDHSAKLNVHVHVSEPLGETLELSPKMAVTMLINRDCQLKKDEKTSRATALGELAPDDDSNISSLFGSELDRFASDAGGDKDFDIELTNELEGEGSITAASNTSSAYLSFDDDHYYPAKSGAAISSDRSHSTATTHSSSYHSTLSDLTDHSSWLSRQFKHITLSSQPKDTSKQRHPFNSQPNSDLDESTLHSKSTVYTTRDVKNWRQRLVCGLPLKCNDYFADDDYNAVFSPLDEHDGESIFTDESLVD